MFLGGRDIGLINTYAMCSIIWPVMKDARTDELAACGCGLGFGEGKYARQNRFLETRPPSFSCAPYQDHPRLRESLD